MTKNEHMFIIRKEQMFFISERTVISMKYAVKSTFRFTTFVVILIITGVCALNLLLGTTTEVGAEEIREYQTIEICAGDTLWSIADAYMPDDRDTREAVYELRELNDLDPGYAIQAGDRIQVPLN